MINTLTINNYKSIKDLKIDCKKVNIFIGKPNSGKSNLLEVFGLLSWIGNRNYSLKDYLRFKTMSNLFYDELIEDPIKIGIDSVLFSMNYQSGMYNFDFSETNYKLSFENDGQFTKESPTRTSTINKILNDLSQVKYYKFKKLSSFKRPKIEYLEPPYGENLFSVIYFNRKYREVFNRFVKEFGYYVDYKPDDRIFNIQKHGKDITSLPFILASDTLKIIIFYLFAIISNKNSTLIFEEPEAHAFPYYTKYIAEKIAKDESNQYFIATHNNYFLTSILEKTPKEKINVFATYLDNYQTQVKQVKQKQIEEILNYDLDPFFNIDSFYEE